MCINHGDIALIVSAHRKMERFIVDTYTSLLCLGYADGVYDCCRVVNGCLLIESVEVKIFMKSKIDNFNTFELQYRLADRGQPFGVVIASSLIELNDYLLGMQELLSCGVV